MKLKPPSSKTLALAGGAIVLAAVISTYAYRSRSALDISYREAQAQRSRIAVTILATGVVQPENRLEIKPPVAGRIEQVLVKEGQKVRKGQILAWMSSTERAALLDAARAKGEEETRRWEELYRPTPVLAPIPGTIILRNVESGQTFTAADAVFVMSDRLTVKAQVDETDIGQVQLGQKARIVLDAYPGESIRAQVDQIAYEAKTTNNVTTYEVNVLPAETPAHMRSGMTANVTFLVASKDDALVVPADAVKVRERASYVLVRDPDGRPAERPVEVGLTDGKRSEITSGLKEGETVLIAQLKAGGSRGQSAGNPFMPMGRGRGGGKPGK